MIWWDPHQLENAMKFVFALQGSRPSTNNCFFIIFASMKNFQCSNVVAPIITNILLHRIMLVEEIQAYFLCSAKCRKNITTYSYFHDYYLDFRGLRSLGTNKFLILNFKLIFMTRLAMFYRKQ